MRTKTLLVTLALSATCAIQSIAQVYSVNAVGYVNVTIPAGGAKPVFQMICNPLVVANNTLEALIPNPNPGTIVYRFIGGAFVLTTFDEFDMVWTPANQSLDFGGGAFIANPAGAPQMTITFVGEVAQNQGTQFVTNDIPHGYSIRSSKVPQAGLITTALAFPATAGDIVYKFDVPTQQFKLFTFDEFDLAWLPSEPSLAVGESFFVSKQDVGYARWSRNFSVNQ